MNSAFAFIVGLLQAALSLLGFVHANPSLPQVQQDQAQQVAQQAISQATQALSQISVQTQAQSQTISSQITLSIGPAKKYEPGTLASEIEFIASAELPVAKGYVYPNVGDGVNYGDGRTIPVSFKDEVYTVDYGDGTTESLTFTDVVCAPVFCTAEFYAPTHMFSKQGVYTAVLYKNGNKISTHQFVVYNAPTFQATTASGPAGLRGPSGPAPLMVTFTFSGGTTIDYGDGTPRENLCNSNCTQWSDAGHIVTHTFTKPGHYQVDIWFNDFILESYNVTTTSIDNPTLTITADSAVSIPGMSQYTDPDFGFSFWYPTGWQLGVDVQSEANARAILSNTSPNTVLEKTINQTNGTVGDKAGLWIISAPSASFTLLGTDLHDVNRYTFSYSSNTKQWTVTSDNRSPDYNEIRHLDTSQTTMGGMSMIAGFYNIIPISNTTFIVIPN